MKLRLCWTDAPDRWAKANFPGEVVGVVGGVKNHMIPQALEDDLVAALRKHSAKEWEPVVVAERDDREKPCHTTALEGGEEQAKRKQIREDNLIGEAGI